MARGIERRPIFVDRFDRTDFLARLQKLVDSEALVVFAWALMENHFHLLVQTAKRPLSSSMRSLLTGYAVRFNRRHDRVGHLFQNRFKSIVCDEETYFLELVRYIHLNPLRAGLVRDLEALDSYRYSGHSAIVGRVERPWQAVDAVLGRFARQRRPAIDRYRAFVAATLLDGRHPELMGGGLVRSVGGWRAVAKLKRGREEFLSDERILGSSTFVGRVRREVESGERPSSDVDLEALIDFLSGEAGISRAALRNGSRRRAVSELRAELCWVWTRVLGRSGSSLARELGLATPSILAAAARHAEKGHGPRTGIDELCFAHVRRTSGRHGTRVSEDVSRYDTTLTASRSLPDFRRLVHRLAKERRVPAKGFWEGRRDRRTSALRSEVCWTWIERCGGNGRELARWLGIAPQSAYAASERFRTP